MREYLKENEKEPEKVKEELKKQAIERYEQKEKDVGDQMRELERVVMLKVVDEKWMNHIDSMDELKNGIGLRAYGQKNPLVEYKFEAFEMFQNMIAAIQDETIMALYKIRAQLIQEIEEPVDHLEGAQPHHEDVLEPQNID